MRDLENRLFLATALDFPIVVGGAPDPGLARLVEFVHDNSIDVVIIDPFVACHRVPENDNTLIDSVPREGRACSSCRETGKTS